MLSSRFSSLGCEKNWCWPSSDQIGRLNFSVHSEAGGEKRRRPDKAREPLPTSILALLLLQKQRLETSQNSVSVPVPPPAAKGSFRVVVLHCVCRLRPQLHCNPVRIAMTTRSGALRSRQPA